MLGRRVRVYVDGFNLYHAIDDLGQNNLKWFDFMSYSKSLLRDGEVLDQVNFFTAILKWDAAKCQRHNSYVDALTARGVSVVNSNFKKQRKFCFDQDRYCNFREEKKTDVAIATSILSDAIRERFDRAILITGDSDQVPTIIAAKRENPAAEFSLVLPPGRTGKARELNSHFSPKGKELTPGRMRRHLLPRNVYTESGVLAAPRPAVYAEK